MSDEVENMTRDDRWSALLRQANAGNRSAYVSFLRDITPVLRGIITARSGDAVANIEDILQNTLIAIHEKRHTWRDCDPVSPWLYAIARYKVSDALRSQRRERTVPFDGAEHEVPDTTAADPTVSGDIESLLAHLDDITAGIVRDIKLHGMSAEEAGARRNMTAGAVRVALHRAMARLASLAQSDAAQSPQEKRRR